MCCLVKSFQLLVIFFWGGVVVGVEKFCPINKRTLQHGFFGVDDFLFKKKTLKTVLLQRCVLIIISYFLCAKYLNKDSKMDKRQHTQIREHTRRREQFSKMQLC